MTEHPDNSIDQLRPTALLVVSEGLKPLYALKIVRIHRLLLRNEFP